MCRILRYQKITPDRAIGVLFHTQKSEEKIVKFTIFLFLHFCGGLSRFANIIATRTSGFRIVLSLFVPSRVLTTFPTLLRVYGRCASFLQ